MSAVNSTSTLNSSVLSGKREPGLKIAERILLPVDEVLGRGDLQVVIEDRRAAMRSRPQPDDLRAQRHGPVVLIMGDVGQRDVNGHGVTSR